MLDSAEALHDRLVSLLARASGDASVAVSDLERLPAGGSRHTWAFHLSGERIAPRDLILRLDAPGSVEADAIRREAALMTAAAAAGVPSPEVVTVGDADGGLGAAYVVMERVEGESIPRRILRDPDLAAVRDRLAADCGRAIARIHAISPGVVPDLEARDELQTLRELFDAACQAHPAFELAFRWLGDHRPAPAAARVVHGDFRNGNLIIGTDGIRAVLDWELAHLGDPLEDLGWLCVKAWRFGAEPDVGGFGTVSDLVAAYETESGTVVDLDALHWWHVLGTLKWGVLGIHQAERHRSGAMRSVELAAIGRRVAETEWDLLQLLPRG